MPRIAVSPPADDAAILLFGTPAERRALLPLVRDEARRRGLGIVPCAAPAEATLRVASQPALLVCIVPWHEDAARLVGFIEDLRRRQANPLLEIVVSSAVPLTDLPAARLRALRVTLHRRRGGGADEVFVDVLASAVRHALEKRALNSVRGAPPLSPMRTRGLVELAGVFGSAMQRRNAGDLLRLLPPLRSGEVTAIARRAGTGPRRPSRRRKPAAVRR